MSRKLLQFLNGSNTGLFRKWLNDQKGEPRIAWYPSAGDDFRDLLYLHPEFAVKKNSPATTPEPQCPDIFLHTDFYSQPCLEMIENRGLTIDDRTSISFSLVEELPRCRIPPHEIFFGYLPDDHEVSRVFFLWVEVNSHVLGRFFVPVVYALVENAAFCADRVLPLHGVFSHIIHVRYGIGSGAWLLNVLRQMHCKCFITDGHHCIEPNDEDVIDSYPALAGEVDETQLEKIRVVPGYCWSGHGDVSWNIVN